MDTLWSLEDKWKLSTKKAIAIFGCTSFLVMMSICIVGLLKRKKSRRKSLVGVHHEPCDHVPSNVGIEPPQACRGWHTVKKALTRSVCWSGPRRWEEGLRASQREGPMPLLVGREIGRGGGVDVGWQSHNSCSAVWQKPILMGEKCELPRFSGLILYDQRGRPLVHQWEQVAGATIKKQILPSISTNVYKHLLGESRKRRLML